MGRGEKQEPARQDSLLDRWARSEPTSRETVFRSLRDTPLAQGHCTWHLLAQPASKAPTRRNDGILPAARPRLQPPPLSGLALGGEAAAPGAALRPRGSAEAPAARGCAFRGRCPAPRSAAGINLPTSLRSPFISGHPAAARLRGRRAGRGFIAFLEFQIPGSGLCPYRGASRPPRHGGGFTRLCKGPGGNSPHPAFTLTGELALRGAFILLGEQISLGMRGRFVGTGRKWLVCPLHTSCSLSYHPPAPSTLVLGVGAFSLCVGRRSRGQRTFVSKESGALFLLPLCSDLRWD